MAIEIGSASPTAAEQAWREREYILNGWRAALKGPLSVESWRTVGAQLDAELRGSEQRWVQNLGDEMPRLRRLREAIRAQGGHPNENTVLVDSLLDGAPAATSPPLQQRMEAYVAYMLHKLDAAETDVVEENDYCDSRHLQKLWRAGLPKPAPRTQTDIGGHPRR